MQQFKFICTATCVLLLCHPGFALDDQTIKDIINKSDAVFDSSSFSAHVSKDGKPSDNIISTRLGSKYRYQSAPASSKTGKSAPMVLLFDGQDEFTTIGTSVTITRTASRADSPSNRMTDLQPGACFFKGRGLSLLLSPKFSVPGNSTLVMMEGRTPDGERIRAMLDPKQKNLARRIERFAQNGQVGVIIETQGQQNGGLMPLSSTVKLVKMPKLPVYSYEFTGCSFGKKPKFPFQFSIAAPAIITDARSGDPLVIRKKTSTPMTKADIFAITDKLAGKLNAVNDQERSLKNNQKRMNLVLTAGPLVAAVLLLCWRSKKRAEVVS